MRKEFLQQPAFEVVVTDEVVSYVNRKGTRRFYAMQVSGGKDIVVKLIRRVDDIMASFNLKVSQRSKNPCVNAWAETSGAPMLHRHQSPTIKTHGHRRRMCFRKISRCRIGDRVNIIRLKASAAVESPEKNYVYKTYMPSFMYVCVTCVWRAGAEKYMPHTQHRHALKEDYLGGCNWPSLGSLDTRKTEPQRG